MDYSENGLLEEELEIIEVFNYEMNQMGYKGYYSFYSNVDNGYFIYKEGNIWVVNFNEKKQTTSQKKYTNIYNLCLDILNDLKISSFCFTQRNLKLPYGTKVIITKSTDCVIDEINEGIVVDSSLSHHDNNESRRVYTVLGSDGKIYNGLYGLNMYSDVYFRTLEDYIRDITKEISENKESIQELYETNWNLYLMLDDVINQKEKYLETGNKLKKR